MKILRIAIASMLVLTLSTLQAQDYKTGIGVRGAVFAGLTVKHFISQQHALEGILATRWGGFEITGLYQVHQRIADIQRLNWYYGGGAHIGFWEGATARWMDDADATTVIGIDGILGLEYNFEEIPINISLDWKPALNIIGYTGFWGDNGALSVRFIF